MLRKHQLSLIDCEREINVYNYVTESLERKSKLQSVGILVGSHVTFNVLPRLQRGSSEMRSWQSGILWLSTDKVAVKQAG